MRHRSLTLMVLLLLPLARPMLAGVDAWTRIGPDAGIVRALAAAPSSPSTVYAGLGVGGVFRSLDGGTTWSFAGGSLNLHDTVRALLVDARQPDLVWAATFQGIRRSVNGGASWSSVYSGNVAALAQDAASGTLYAGVQSGPMLRSLDGGASWQEIARSPANAFVLALDPFHRQTLYAATLSGVFKSTNGGASWFPINHGLPAGTILGFAVDPRSGALYAATTSLTPGKTVFRSDDGGARWTLVDGNTLPANVTGLAVQPGKRGIVLAVAEGRPFRSLDRGRTWSPAGDELGAGTVFTLLPGASALLAGTALGVFRSGDQGASWSWSSRGIQAAPISGLDIDRLRPMRLWAVVNGGEVYRTATGGGQWSLPNGPPPAIDVNGPLAADPSRPGVAYLGLLGGVAHTGDAGSHWISGPSLDCLQPESIAVASWDSSVYVAGSFFDTSCGTHPGLCEVFRSDDSGQHWTCIESGLPGAFFLAPDPLQPSRVYALSGEDLYVSADRGGSWSLLAAGVKLRFLVPDPHRPGTLWGGGSSVLSRSDDGGRTWAPSGTGIPQFTLLSTLILDPVDPDVLYAGTLHRGVFRSSDGGITWAPLGSGLEGINVRYLVIDPRSPNTLYAGTDEAGVMKIRQSGG